MPVGLSSEASSVLKTIKIETASTQSCCEARSGRKPPTSSKLQRASSCDFQDSEGPSTGEDEQAARQRACGLGCFGARSKRAWLLLVLLSSLLHRCSAAGFSPATILKGDGLRTMAASISMGVDADALTCPASPITTPLSLRMVCFVALFYVLIIILLVVWLLWKRALWWFYVRRQVKRTAVLHSSAASSSDSDSSSHRQARRRSREAARDKDYICVSPILEHGGMFLQQHGYRVSVMGSIVHLLVVASIALSVILPFLAGFAANSLMPSYKVTQYFSQFLYKDFQGLAPGGGVAGWDTASDPVAITASPQCIKLRVYIFAICFMWCLAWMVVVHCCRHKIRLLRLTPACLSNATHMLVERKLQKILLLPVKRDTWTSAPQSASTDDSWEGLELLANRSDLGEPPLLSTFEKISKMPHSPDRYAETSRIRLVYDAPKGYFRPVAAIHERKARDAAFSLADAIEEGKLSGEHEEDGRKAFLENLRSVLVPQDEIDYRLDAYGEGGLSWSVRPVSTLLVASFLQDEFYLVTLMALWFQAFSLNNLQAVILLLLPLVELGFGVYSLRRGEQQLVGIMQREAAALEKRRILCVRQRTEAYAFAAIEDTEDQRSSEPVIVLRRTRGTHIVPGDIVLLQPGDEVPCDLLLVHGSVSLDESHLTGETEPVMKVPLRRKPRHESLESFNSEIEPAKVAEDEVLDPSSVSGNVFGCIYAGSKIIHTSCRSDIAATTFEGQLERSDAPLIDLEKELDDPVSFLLEGECCWGVAVRTHGETMRGQLLRQLQLPMIIRFKYHDQFPYVLMIVTLFALVLAAVQTGFTRNLVDTFRFGVEKVLRMLPLYLPALWGLCASINAKRLSNGLSSSLPQHRTYKAAAVFPGLLPLAAKIRVICFDKTGTLTQSALTLLGTHAVADGSFQNLVLYNPDEEEGLIDSVHVERSEDSNLPLTEATRSLATTLRPSMLQCLACCNSLHLTPHGMASWTRKQQKTFRDKYVFQAEELRRISDTAPQLSPADIDGVDLEKQALLCSGFNLIEIASSSLTKAERPHLTRATTAWAAEMQKQRKTRQFLIPKVEPTDTDQPPMLEIVGSYCFDQDTGMMSVIVRECQNTEGCRGQKGYIFCKGRYEEVAKACVSSSVPSDFVECGRKYAKDGIYVVGAAYRDLTAEELEELDTRESNPPRAVVESNLSCLGLVLFRNELRSDAKEALETLKEGGIRCVMLTGDNPYTALAVARRAHMIQSSSRSHQLVNREDSLSVEHQAAVRSHPTVLLGNVAFGPLDSSPFGGEAGAQTLKWTNMNTGEEVDPWKVYYTEEFKELVVTMAAAKILMKEPDAQLLPVNDSEEEIEDPWRRRSRQEALREHEARSSLLPEKTDWQSETPSLFDRVFFRIRIFARMSPMGKKLIVLNYQRRGLTTCMVGDGSNDSLAIRQADLGVEMGQVQPAPFSAPFAILQTSEGEEDSQRPAGKDGVWGVVDIIRAGRCSLSTAMAIYRLHISYGLLAATASLLVVMAQYGGLNTASMLFLDIVVLIGLSGAMLFSSPVNGPLAKKSPPSSPFGAGIVLSVLSLVAVDLAALALLLYLFYGPGGFPPPCYWIQSRLRAALQEQKDKIKEILSSPILKREKVLDQREAELKAEEKRVEVMKNALEKRTAESHQGSLQDKPTVLGPPQRPVQDTGTTPSAAMATPTAHSGSLSPAFATDGSSSLGGPYSQREEKGTYDSALHPPLSNGLRFPVDYMTVEAVETQSLRPMMHNHQLHMDPSPTWNLSSFFEGGYSRSAFLQDSDSPGTICSTDGHAESALIFVWAGICTLHAAMLFISGNVFRKPAWKNRVLLPVSVLLLAFFIAVMLVPPGPFPCVFNIKCTSAASDALHKSPMYPLVQAMAGDSAASTLHDAAAGPSTLEAAASKAAAEAQQTSPAYETLTRRLPSPSAAEYAAFMKETQRTSRHLWTEDEATTLSTWFSHALLCVLIVMCIVNTLIQFHAGCVDTTKLLSLNGSRQAAASEGARGLTCRQAALEAL
ncbi:hypothetical protein Efla_007079 [Eimeria flavescens]